MGAKSSEVRKSMPNHGLSGEESNCSDETTLSPPLDDFAENFSPRKGVESYMQCRNWISQNINIGRLNLEPVSFQLELSCPDNYEDFLQEAEPNSVCESPR